MTTGNHPKGIVERMHAELDGANTPSQSQELKDYLTAHPEARREFDELKALTVRLDAEPQVEPPAHMIHRILAAIPFGIYPRASRERATGGLGAWVAHRLPRTRLRYASVFGLGVVAGFILLWTAVSNRENNAPLDVTNLYGTMRVIEPTDGFKVVGEVGVDLGQVHGEIRLHESDRKLMAEVSLDPSDPIEWVLHYGTDVVFEGYRQILGAANTISAAGGEMKVSQVGEGRFILFFTENNGADAPMSIEIFGSGKRIYQKELMSVRG